MTAIDSPRPVRPGEELDLERLAPYLRGVLRAPGDAEVAVQLFMPAMPTMNMPAMRNETKLPHVGGGVYRGIGQVMMAGHWDVTVVVSKGGRQLGQRQLTFAAR